MAEREEGAASTTRRSVLQALSTGVGAFALGGARAARAADWPTKTVTIVVPYPPGGNTDTMARLLADFMTKKYKQTFIVDNRATAGGTLAAAQVAKSRPDGYTMMFGAGLQAIIAPMLQKVAYDPETDFQYLSIFGTGPYILGARASLPVSTLDELVAYAKQNPGKLNVATASIGGQAHLSSLLLAKRAGIDLTMVPYRGGGPAVAALLAGETDLYFGNASEMLQHKGTGKLKLLAVSTLQPIPQAPELQTVASILPGFEMTSWNGLFGPVGMPKDIVAAIAATTAEASKSPDIAQRLLSLGIEPIGSTPEDMTKIVSGERKVYREAIEISGLEQQK